MKYAVMLISRPTHGKSSWADCGSGDWSSLARSGYLSLVNKMKKALRLWVFFIALMSACYADAFFDNTRKAAEQGDAEAQLNLGVMYCQYDGVKRDPVEAMKWFRKSAEQGNAIAQYRLGFAYDTGDGVTKDLVEAVKWYRKSAEQGEAIAQYDLAVMYHQGSGVAKDAAEAAKWWRRAAERGNSQAQFIIGELYAFGDGVTQDHVEAVNWFRKAAFQGHSQAQYDLGLEYVSGKGVIKDSVEGLAWLNIAAMSGSENVIKSRDTLEQVVGPEGALSSQQRSKQILHDIELAKHAAGAPSNNTPSADASYASEDQKPRMSGSGAIVTTQGYVLTAAHVVVGAKRLTVTTGRGVRNATILCIDEANDLAILKITEGTYKAIPLTSSKKVQLGQIVATIGFPNVEIQGFSPKVTRGEISSLNGIGDDPRAWQISVPVQPGNSGGPLLDENGNLVGVVVSKLGLKVAKLTGDIPQNVNYAVKGAYALALLEPYLGNDAPEPNQPAIKPRFEDMVARAQQSVVLILVY